MNALSFLNIKKALTQPLRIIPTLERHYNKEKIVKNINKKKIIWHFCTPKSASSYLTHLLANLKLNTISSMPYYGNRIQINDFFDLHERMKTYPLAETHYITHQHTVCDNYLKKYISKNHKVIIQTRNIYQTILSLKDMILKKKIFKKNPFVSISNKLSEKEILKLLIYNYVPFHCNFIKSWIENSIKGKKIFINYLDFVINEKFYIKKILNSSPRSPGEQLLKIPEFNKINKKKMKFHIGLKRTNTLDTNEKKLIDEIVNIHTKHSNPKIKSLIYLN